MDNKYVQQYRVIKALFMTFFYFLVALTAVGLSYVLGWLFWNYTIPTAIGFGLLVFGSTWKLIYNCYKDLDGYSQNQ